MTKEGVILQTRLKTVVELSRSRIKRLFSSSPDRDQTKRETTFIREETDNERNWGKKRTFPPFFFGG